MSNRYDPSTLSLDAAITIYLRSEYYTQLAPITRNKRRGVLRSMRAEVLRLSAEGLSETSPPHPVLPPARSVPWLSPHATICSGSAHHAAHALKPAEGLAQPGAVPRAG